MLNLEYCFPHRNRWQDISQDFMIFAYFLWLPPRSTYRSFPKKVTFVIFKLLFQILPTLITISFVPFEILCFTFTCVTVIVTFSIVINFCALVWVATVATNINWYYRLCSCWLCSDCCWLRSGCYWLCSGCCWLYRTLYCWRFGDDWSWLYSTTGNLKEMSTVIISRDYETFLVHHSTI
jgi:hypothetical protein